MGDPATYTSKRGRGDQQKVKCRGRSAKASGELGFIPNHLDRKRYVNGTTDSFWIGGAPVVE
jgi:hypothetical protein